MTTVKSYHVYVLRNQAGNFYIGLSENVSARRQQHNDGKSSWTRSRGPWQLVWTSAPMSLTEARQLENHLKRQKGGIAFYQATGLQRSQGS